MPDQPQGPDDWIRYARVDAADEALLRRRRNRRRGSPAVGGVILIAAGVLLFLDNIGAFRIREIWQFWPVLFIWFGVVNLVGKREPSRHVLGALLVPLGVLLILVNLHVIELHARNEDWIAALLLITFGVVALTKALERSAQSDPNTVNPMTDQARPPRPNAGGFGPSPGGFAPPRREYPSRCPDSNSLYQLCVMGSVKRRIDAAAFQGGLIRCVLGNLELDFRGSQINNASHSATVLVQNTGGLVKIRVPETWRVSLTGSGIVGSFEDKTIPPHTGAETPWLVITGSSIGGVTEIEN